MPKKKITIDDLAGMVHKGFLSMDKKMDKGFELVNKRFNSVDKRFEAVDGHFNAIERRLDKVINKHEERMVNLESEVQELKDILHIANF